MKTDEHNKFRWLMLLATLSALVASFVMRHLQDAGTMEPLQHGLLVYCCVVVVVLLVVMVKHLPAAMKAAMKRNVEEERAKRQKMEQLFREAERNERERRKQRDYISDEEIENEIKRICIDNNSDFIPML